jgi:hypothetical protein
LVNPDGRNVAWNGPHTLLENAGGIGLGNVGLAFDHHVGGVVVVLGGQHDKLELREESVQLGREGLELGRVGVSGDGQANLCT